jgi:hypothetical protein
MDSRLTSIVLPCLLAFAFLACGGGGAGPADVAEDAAAELPGDIGADAPADGTGEEGRDALPADLPDADGSRDAQDADVAPEVPCECTTNDDCTGSFRGLGACERAVCDPGSCACVRQNAPEDVVCDDGNPCTTGDRCAGGACVGGTNDCSCQADQDCLPREDGNPCNGTLICNKTVSPYTCTVAPETVVLCTDDDPVPCTQKQCNPATGQCEPVAVDEGLGCTDLDPCTTGDTCTGGVCTPGGTMTCNDNEPCTGETCVPGEGCVYRPMEGECDDGNPCTLADACFEGRCKPGALDPCDDGNACTLDSCVTGVGCHHVNRDDAPCTDGDACTVGDWCDGSVCTAGDPAVIDDDNPCTTDSCLPVGGVRHVANQDPCDDGDPCTIGDRCADDACQAGGPADCDDDDACTGDSCAPLTGLCVYVPVDVDDGDPCTVDACIPPTGNIVHTPKGCSDGNTCNGLEACDPLTGACVPGTPLACDDGNACNGPEACNAAAGCQPGTPPACNDGDRCNGIESCDPTSGACVPGEALVCDDADPCNGQEACDATAGCVPGTPPACDDGLACNGVESCHAFVGCVAGTPRTCSDNNVCTTDRCTDPVGDCTNLPAPTLPCDDLNACTGSDTCSLVGSCIGGTETCCTDGNDNDGDGLTDCRDPDCASNPNCAVAVTWCRLQYPATILSLEAVPTTVYGRVYIAGLTSLTTRTDPYPALKAQAGYGPNGSDPTAAGWTWFDAAPNTAYDGNDFAEPNNDEYMAALPAPASGGSPYDFAYRFSGDNGTTWTMCDLNAGDGKDGSQDGYQASSAGDLVVTAP